MRNSNHLDKVMVSLEISKHVEMMVLGLVEQSTLGWNYRMHPFTCVRP